ncbi:ATP-dependent DNA/RNA helicase dhx36 [Cichlidogyrus casuarinus]|uniref:ATP-dependent DNA/RNA helicase dhx36 n=1 Tax=Cichlidogyrus casuarinus TaxID=1844966 RepID=A0ABD2Q880_9PLAT
MIVLQLLELGAVVPFLSECLSVPSLTMINRTLRFLEDIQALDLLEGTGSNDANSLDAIDKKRAGGKKKFTRELQSQIRAANTLPEATSAEDCRLTPLGIHLSRLPLDPQCAKLLLMGSLFGCLKPALIVASSLSFKSPFITNFSFMGAEAEHEARKARLRLAGDTLSDHIATVAAVQDFEEIGSRESARRDFCRKNFLNYNAIKDLNQLMRDYSEMLHQFRYISSFNINDSDSNVNAYNMNLFRAILCAAFYPNITSTVNSGGRNSASKLIARDNERLKIHEVSVNSNISSFGESLYFTYFDKMRFDENASTSTLFDTTLLLPRSLLFFAGHPQVGSSN